MPQPPCCSTLIQRSPYSGRVAVTSKAWGQHCLPAWGCSHHLFLHWPALEVVFNSYVPLWIVLMSIVTLGFHKKTMLALKALSVHRP
eukprot:scaffold129502_cov19-Tisochrysis_lutea.AAC.1